MFQRNKKDQISPVTRQYLVERLMMKYQNRRSFWFHCQNNKKRSHTQLDSRKQVIAFQDRVITINIKEAQHALK